MWLYFLLTLIASVAAENGQINFKKCCQNGETLKKVMLEETVNYVCVAIEDSSLVFSDKYNVSYGYPESCNVSELNETDGGVYSDEEQCIDKITVEVFNETETTVSRIVTLSCNLQLSDSLIQIEYANKCCGKRHSYDANYHVCRSDSNVYDEEDLLRKINKEEDYIYDVVNINIQTSLDNKKQYAVELKEYHFKLSLVGSTLNVIKLDDKVEMSIEKGDWCIDEDYSDHGLVARVLTDDCKDFDGLCIRKCCKVGEHYLPRRATTTVSDCVRNTNEEQLFDLTYYLQPLRKNGDFKEIIGLRSGLQCSSGKFMMKKTADSHYLSEDGLLINSISVNGYTRDFCFETFDNTTWGGEITVETMACFEPVESSKNFSISFMTITISCVFLVLTLMVYLALPELRNLHGRTLICHVCVMLLAYGCLARVQYSYVDDSRVCTFYGYSIYFGFVAAFSWLNVMCFDIWWTFGSMRSMQPFHKKNAERRRFIWYSLYAWSLSISLTVTMLLLDLYPVSEALDANIGQGICWFGSIQNSNTDWPHYIFFVVPMGIITCVNLVLWILTSRHCARVKSEVHRMQAGSVGDGAKKRFRADRAKYLLTVRLWVVMGAGWVWEIVSTVMSEPKWLWTSVDVVNELQGVFIFIILVLKPKVFFLIRKKLGIAKDGKQKNGGVSTRTSSTFLSRTISQDERTTLRTSLPANKIK